MGGKLIVSGVVIIASFGIFCSYLNHRYVQSGDQTVSDDWHSLVEKIQSYLSEHENDTEDKNQVET